MRRLATTNEIAVSAPVESVLCSLAVLRIHCVTIDTLQHIVTFAASSCQIFGSTTIAL